MSEFAIRADNLSKRYRIGPRESYKALRDTLTDALAAPFRRLRRRGDGGRKTGDGLPGPRSPVPGHDSHIWALQDVSFEVKPGEVVGIIGRNGAGKSTLLKILSRITRPTRGRAEIRGRVGSLLEVGTGFHPELTGRENTYLNGAILGMGRAEIDSKFGEIVAFAEVEKFIDTPVKRYSSGMYVRLAFAVAAHLEPEILLVDEVLAVGDAEFQKKCLGKMGDVAKEGRTVLLVSHNMGAITRLCRRAILLDQGRVRLCAPSDEAVAQYLSLHSTGSAEFAVARPSPAPGHPDFTLRAVRVKDSRGALAASIDIRHPFCVEIEYDLRRPINGLRVGFRLLTSEGVVVFSSTDRDQEGAGGPDRTAGVHRSRCEIPGGFLNKGHYSVSLGIDVPMVQSILFLDGVVSFFVEPTGGLVGAIPDNRLGVVCPRLPWTVERL
ncbi:MAG: ABC transporter ATP-binding protein [candidate division NC10 bacterium]|nr:ABC transporter ATP-binding protein [candidate division NC10 bacterium]